MNLEIFDSQKYYNLAKEYISRGNLQCAYILLQQAIYYKRETDEEIDKLFNEISKKVYVPKISIIILSYNNVEYTKECIESIRRTTNKETYEIVVVDNNSNKETIEELKKEKDIKLKLNNENRGFPGGCNDGINISEKDNDILLLNNDTVVTYNSIFNLRLGLYSSQDIGATGAISNSVSNLQIANYSANSMEEYMDLALKNNMPSEAAYEERTKLVAFAMLIKRKVLNEIGLLDERYFPGNYEDDDISVRIALNNYRLLLCLNSFIYHYGSSSFSVDRVKFNNVLIKNREKFKEKWGFDANESFCYNPGINFYIDKENINILFLFCKSANNLMLLQRDNDKAIYYGYEENYILRKICNTYNVKIIDNLNEKKYRNMMKVVIVEDYIKLLSYDYIDNIRDMLVDDGGKIILAINGVKEVLTEDKLDTILYKIINKGFILETTNISSNDGMVNYAYIIFRKTNLFNIENNELYNEFKFILRRLDFNRSLDNEKDLIEMIKDNNVDYYDINNIIDKDIINKDEVKKLLLIILLVGVLRYE